MSDKYNCPVHGVEMACNEEEEYYCPHCDEWYPAWYLFDLELNDHSDMVIDDNDE